MKKLTIITVLAGTAFAAFAAEGSKIYLDDTSNWETIDLADLEWFGVEVGDEPTGIKDYKLYQDDSEPENLKDHSK